MRIKSLNQRFMVFLVLPVAILLFGTGFLGFFYARGIMLEQWRKGAVMRLQWAAHHMDMRLAKPVELIEMFHEAVIQQPHRAVQDWLLERIEAVDGVISVNLDLPQRGGRGMGRMFQRGAGPGKGVMMGSHREKVYTISTPRFDTTSGTKAVDIVSEFRDQDGTILGKLTVSISFDYVMQDIVRLGWWESELACLVDESGMYLAQTKELETRSRLGEGDDPLELAVLTALKEKEFGTFLGEGHPPEMVAGFHKLTRAPWAIVMFAPGRKILEPIVRFRNYYLLAMAFSIAVILVLIRLVTGKAVRSIREISEAAGHVAQGRYIAPLEVRSADEIGRLVNSFNRMIEGLKERDFIRDTFGRYVDPEVAEELLKRPEASRLGGEKREVVILMSDIRGFSSLTETLSPESVITALNKHFSHVIEVVQEHRGIIVDFFGDGVLVFFDPLGGPIKEYVLKALRCALKIQERVNELGRELEEMGFPGFKIGIGINAGEVVVGNIGSETRAKYGIVGAPVNAVHRIQAEAKGGEVVVAERIYSCVSDVVDVVRSFKVEMKGFRQPQTLYVIRLKKQVSFT